MQVATPEATGGEGLAVDAGEQSVTPSYAIPTKYQVKGNTILHKCLVYSPGKILIYSRSLTEAANLIVSDPFPCDSARARLLRTMELHISLLLNWSAGFERLKRVSNEAAFQRTN